MLRECTDAENRILKESRADVLTHPELYAFANHKGILPLLLGLPAGLGVSSLLAIVLHVKSRLIIYLIFIFCDAVAIGVAELFWQRHGSKKSRKASLPGKRFRVNGGMILSYEYLGNGRACLTFAEDDLRDGYGNPVCIQYPAPLGLGVSPGQRILLAYSDNGAYIPLAITPRTAGMVPAYPPEYMRQVNWTRVAQLPHPAALGLDIHSFQINEKEAKDFVRGCNSLTEIRVKNWVGIILSSILILLVLGVLFLFLVVAEIVKNPFAILVLAGMLFVVWGSLAFLFARAALSGAIRGLKRIRYRKRVMFLETGTSSNFNGVPTSCISVLECVEGELRQKNYIIGNNVFLPKDIPYGRLIYKYSKEAESYEKGLNYFCER